MISLLRYTHGQRLQGVIATEGEVRGDKDSATELLDTGQSKSASDPSSCGAGAPVATASIYFTDTAVMKANLRQFLTF